MATTNSTSSSTPASKPSKGSKAAPAPAPNLRGVGVLPALGTPTLAAHHAAANTPPPAPVAPAPVVQPTPAPATAPVAPPCSVCAGLGCSACAAANLPTPSPRGRNAHLPTPKMLGVLRLLAAAPGGTLHRKALAARTGVAKGWAALMGAQGSQPAGTVCGNGWATLGVGANGVQYTITAEGRALLGGTGQPTPGQ